MMRRLMRGLWLLAAGALWAPRLWAQTTVPMNAPITEPVAARAIARGVALTRDDINADSLPAIASDRLVGYVTQRALRMGEPLRAPAIAPAAIVMSGSAVTVEAVAEGVRLTRPGTALTAGALGATIRVRLDARRTVSAIVMGPSLLRLP